MKLIIKNRLVENNCVLHCQMLHTRIKLCISIEPLVEYASGKGIMFIAVLGEARKI